MCCCISISISGWMDVDCWMDLWTIQASLSSLTEWEWLLRLWEPEWFKFWESTFKQFASETTWIRVHMTLTLFQSFQSQRFIILPTISSISARLLPMRGFTPESAIVVTIRPPACHLKIFCGFSHLFFQFPISAKGKVTKNCFLGLSPKLFSENTN